MQIDKLANRQIGKSANWQIGKSKKIILLFKIIVVLLPNFNENYIWQFTKRTTTDLIDTKTPSS